MDSSNFPVGDGKRPPPKNQLQIQGPRPPPLSVHKDSHKIKKPPKPQEQPQNNNHQQPMIIYAVSPKIINVTVGDFMTTVQRLTGVSSGDGDVSPAARMAAVEKVMNNSPKGKGSSAAVMNDGMVVVEEKQEEEEGVEVGRVPGILSPAALPPVVQEMYFSPAPASDPFGLSVMHGNYGFLTSPSERLDECAGRRTKMVCSLLALDVSPLRKREQVRFACLRYQTRLSKLCLDRHLLLI